MRRMGGLDTMDSAGGGMDHLGYTFDLGRGEPARRWADAAEIMAPCGGAMALRRSALEDRKTVFWDKLFLYNEDTDLGFRLWKNGFRVVYEPSAVVEHAMSATAGTASPARIRYCTRNRILVLRRHLGKEFRRIAPILASWEAMLLGYLLARGRIFSFRNSLAGFRQASPAGWFPRRSPDSPAAACPVHDSRRRHRAETKYRGKGLPPDHPLMPVRMILSARRTFRA